MDFESASPPATLVELHCVGAVSCFNLDVVLHLTSDSVRAARRGGGGEDSSFSTMAAETESYYRNSVLK